MLLNVHFYTRQAARESKAARKAVTDAARQRHETMAAAYRARAYELNAPLLKWLTTPADPNAVLDALKDTQESMS